MFTHNVPIGIRPVKSLDACIDIIYLDIAPRNPPKPTDKISTI